jgi:hypothetical protein
VRSVVAEHTLSTPVQPAPGRQDEQAGDVGHR